MPDISLILDLVRNPRESLTIELKSWFDPRTRAGIAKIARFALARRNHEDRFLVVGFDDRSHLPVSTDRPANVREPAALTALIETLHILSLIHI